MNEVINLFIDQATGMAQNIKWLAGICPADKQNSRFQPFKIKSVRNLFFKISAYSNVLFHFIRFNNTIP
jgi:hypothetical protein